MNMMAISHPAKTALSLLGQLIKTARGRHKMSQLELAERLGVSRQTIMALEQGNPKVGVGIVFEAAHIVGVPLLSDNPKEFSQWQAILAGFTAILPARIHSKIVEINDDF